MSTADIRQEEEVASAFSRQSPVFDAIDEENSLLVWMRQRVYQEVMRFARSGDYMLELNCGTGIDALYFARQGLRVKATDNAPGMLQQLRQKIGAAGMADRITAERCSFNNLGQLNNEAPFDYVFSNFGGLNCTEDLSGVLENIDHLLKPGGYFTLVIMPKVCLWEMLLFFKGYFKTAFRRWSRNGTVAHLEGVHFRCYYYPPDAILKQLAGRYELRCLKGLAVTVPPPYIEHFRERRPRLFGLLERWENRLAGRAPFNRWGDHYLITMQKGF